MPRRPTDSPPRDPQPIIEERRRELEQLREDMRRSEIERNRLRRENERLKENWRWPVGAPTGRPRRFRVGSRKSIRIDRAASRERRMAVARIVVRHRVSM